MPARPDIIAAFELQAVKCREMDSPFTAGLLEHAAASLAAGGSLAAVIGDRPGDPVAAALPLRVAGALHAMVLEGAEPELARDYPATERAGRPDLAWRAAERAIARNPEAFAGRLSSPPQTNETGRSLALLPGLLLLARRHELPLVLLELGASAGLNLGMGGFAYRTPAWSRPAPSSVASTVLIDGEWRGPPPPVDAPLQIADRAGCDLNPLDPSDPADQRRLRAYVWADQLHRLARLDAALQLAARSDVRVERADAADWLEPRLANRPADAITVIFHSVVWQYLPPRTQVAVEGAVRAAGAAAPPSAPLAWLRFEPEMIMGGDRGAGRFFLSLVTWPDGREEVLAEVDPHGRWVDWRAQA